MRVWLFVQHHGRASSHRPELILNNFGTRLGHRLGRMFASIFSQDPNFKGRRAVTFHNQRDYIFFRSAPTMPAVAATHHECLYECVPPIFTRIWCQLELWYLW